MNRTDLVVAADHPAFAGHFPGRPILPGAVLLDEALQAIGAVHAIEPSQWRIGSAKFLAAVRPGDALSLEHERLPNGSIRFSLHGGGRLVAGGLLQPGGDDAP